MRQATTPQRLGITGYTLVELVVVVAMLSLMLGIAWVRLRPALEHGKVNAAASVMAADLQYAQIMAARQRKPVVVIVTSASKQYVIRDRADATKVFRTRYFGTDTEYALDTFSASPSTSMVVFPTGVTAATTTFTLGLGGFSRQVRFSKAGQIRVVTT